MFAFIDLRVAIVAVTCLAASVGLGTLTLWFWRNSRLETPVLAPLEVMSERRFTRTPEDQRDRLLDEVRGLARTHRSIAQSPARRTAPMPVEHEWEAGFDEEPLEEFAPDEERPLPVIDPLLGRRGN
jgi:hypothetical protein